MRPAADDLVLSETVCGANCSEMKRFSYDLLAARRLLNRQRGDVHYENKKYTTKIEKHRHSFNFGVRLYDFVGGQRAGAVLSAL